jgi:biopolymer transport protein ExbD
VVTASETQVIAGLEDGVWEPTDEVRGPGEARWVAIEAHPHFAEAAAELEDRFETPLTIDPEEQRIDMNPLIDVCLVLLVFFILATTFGLMDKVLPIPLNAMADRPVQQLTPEQARERMIMVQLRRGPSGLSFLVDDVEVPAPSLPAVLQKRVQLTQRREVVIDAKDVNWGDVVQVIDAAGQSKIKKVHFKVTR